MAQQVNSTALPLSPVPTPDSHGRENCVPKGVPLLRVAQTKNNEQGYSTVAEGWPCEPQALGSIASIAKLKTDDTGYRPLCTPSLLTPNTDRETSLCQT